MTHTIAHDASYDTALAIIGMSGRFPGAGTIEAFWQNIAGGVKSIRFFSDEELKEAGVDPALLRQPNYVKAGTVLENIESFDASFFGYTPREAEIMDPQHRLFMECAWEALEDAACNPETFTGLVGVFAGSAFSAYMSDHIYTNPDVVEMAGRLQIDLGNDRDSLASAVSYKLNLRGPSIAVQTFCSTSLVAVHLACQSLFTYECDIALAGGVAVALPQVSGYLYEEGGILSPDGACRTFDARGLGSVMGNGAGVVAFKRLQEAIEDGDHIYAIVRGSATNNDGSVRVSYTAPGLNGQKEVIAEALGHAGVDLESISYIEAHGTATMLGDAVELAAMIKAFEARTQKKQFCAIGSVKPNVGHLDRASGVTGLIKTALALHHRQIPPSLNFEHASSDIDLDNSPFYVNTVLRDWPGTDTPRRAGVSSFGLGGTNAHLVLEEAPEREPSDPSRSKQLLLLSARTETALQNMATNLAVHLKAHEEQALADVASTLQVGRKVFNHRRIVVCSNREEAIHSLETTDARNVYGLYQTYKDRELVFLFPGVGEQYAGMARELYQEEITFRETMDRCQTLLQTRFGLDLREVLALESQQSQGLRNGHRASTGVGGGSLQALLGRGGRAQTTVNDRLKQTAIAQPVVFVVEYALAQLLMEWGIRPEAMIGYSLGEYVAACLAGVLSLEDALELVTRRAQLIQELPRGAMVAVALSEEAVQPFLDEQICLAAINGPNTCVLSGPVEAIEQIEGRLSEQWIAAQRVDATHAFHSSMLEVLRGPLTELVRGFELHAPRIPYISNVTGTWITDEQATDPAYWAQHMCQTVRFADGAGELLQKPEWLLLEVGPGQSLGAFIRQHPACSHDRLHLVLSTLPSLYERQSDMACLLATVGKLWLAGVTIDWKGFYAHERRSRVSLPTYPFERQRYWIEPLKTTRLTLQKGVPLSKGKRPDLTDWFYLPSWEQKPLLPARAKPHQGPYLVFADACGLGDRLASRLCSEGYSVVIVRPGARFEHVDDQLFVIRAGERADYVALCKALSAAQLMPRMVLHCWQITQEDAEAAGPDYFRSCQEEGFYSLLLLTQAFSSQIYEEPVQFVLFSNHMQAVTGQELLQPEKATILGICKIVPQEHLNISCRSIDLSIAGAAVHNNVYLLDQLVTELNSTNLVVAYRGRTRWVQVYRNVCLDREEDAPSVLRQQGVYVITGGLGNVGMVLAEYLARTVQARLVLIGRSALPERRSWIGWLADHEANDRVSGLIRTLLALEELGSEILIVAADVADSAQFAAALTQAEERFGALHGIIHAAGSSDQAGYQTVQDISQEACELHFQPKAHGVFALEQALQGRELDFCVLFSSISAMLGGLGFAGYAAANIFMDAFVQKHNAAADVPWLSVNWDTWQVKENVHGVLGSTIAEYVMTPNEGTEVFARAVASRINQLVISTGDLETRLDQWIRREPVQSADASIDATTGSGETARPNLSTPYVPASDEYEQKIVDIWQQVLGIGLIGIHDNFFEVGGHSLIGTQLISRLRRTFQVNLPLAMLFEAPTVAELAISIKMKLIEEIDRLDEEEVQRLV